MAWPQRVTAPLLDVLEVFVRAFEDDADDLYGWSIMKATARSGPTIYGILDNLEDAGWVDSRWEPAPPDSGKPRRRLYRLTPTGYVTAQELVTARRPQSTLSVPRPAAATGLVYRALRRVNPAGSN
jgi:PadR family transcriptional regulator PadR